MSFTIDRPWALRPGTVGLRFRCPCCIAMEPRTLFKKRMGPSPNE
ncbi:hypothetical protein [Azospirillum argentinense]